jgi:thioredoxin 2
VRLLKVNTEQQSGLAGQFGIRSIPTLMLIHKGIEIDRLSGALDAAGLIAWTEQALKKA